MLLHLYIFTLWDDDSNSMIFLSFCGANRGGEANVNSLVNEGDIDYRRKRPGQKEAIAALSGRGWKSSSPGNKSFYDYDYYHFLKRAAHLGAGQNLLSDIVRMFEHPSFNFEPHPWMLFQRLTDAKNSREPEHVMVQGDQHLTISTSILSIWCELWISI